MGKKGQVTAPHALLQSAKDRTGAISVRVRDALKSMETDIERHQGLYPYNAGRLTQSEVCRRAGISKQTLQNQTHRNTTRLLIDEWLDTVRRRTITGSHVVRRAVTDRVEAWKKLHSDIAHAYLIDSMHLINARRRINELEILNRHLQAQLDKTSVKRIAILPNKKNSTEPR